MPAGTDPPSGGILATVVKTLAVVGVVGVTILVVRRIARAFTQDRTASTPNVRVQ